MKDSKGYEPSDYITSVSNTLNGLEALKHIRECTEQLSIKGIPTLFQKECYETIKKELEALKIIKKKKVNVSLLSCSEWSDFYNQEIAYKEIELTQEEYDLLKEVLL